MRAKKVTMQDIAEASGVSQSTVSMILNRKLCSFPAETIEKVMNTAAELNYQFRSTTQPHSNNTILVVCVQATNPYYTAMLQGIDRAAVPQSINIVTACTYHNPAVEAAYLQMAVEQHFFGIILLYPPDNEEVFHSVSTRIPVVTICDKSNRVTGDIVELNNFEAGVLAAEHLFSLGHTNIAVLTNTSDRSTTSRATRVAGILSEVRKVVSDDHLLVLTGNNPRSEVIEERDFYYRLGYSLAQNKKLYQNNITGLICLNDLLAYGVMDALIDKGYRIPEDFSLIGSDNLLFSSLSRVSLTTIELHPDIVAQSALTMLLNRTHMMTSSQSFSSARFQVQCQPNLVVRGSTGPSRNCPLTDEKE
jgi:LacI family transcriptional regulator